jgi:hypothetical protein
MLHEQRIVVVMPAYRVEKTLEACHRANPRDVVDEVILVDDASDEPRSKSQSGLACGPSGAYDAQIPQ